MFDGNHHYGLRMIRPGVYVRCRCEARCNTGGKHVEAPYK